MSLPKISALWAVAAIILLSRSIEGDKNKFPSWLGPQDFSIGGVPASRGYFGFAAVKDKLFVFGGGRGTIGWLFIFSSVIHLFISALKFTSHSVFLPEYLNDLHMLDPDSLQWTALSGSTSGGTPSPRAAPGFAQLNDKLYLFGGAYGFGKGCWPSPPPSAAPPH
jgi:hypothetical protein